MKLISIAAAVFTAAADLKIKDVMSELSPGEVIYNKGFAANRLDSRPRLVALVSAAVTAVCAGAFLTTKAYPGEELANGLILGGAISNTSERIARGKVTDYIPLGKYVYNIGDFAIYAGCLIKLVVSFLFKR